MKTRAAKILESLNKLEIKSLNETVELYTDADGKAKKLEEIIDIDGAIEATEGRIEYLRPRSSNPDYYEKKSWNHEKDKLKELKAEKSRREKSKGK